LGGNCQRRGRRPLVIIFETCPTRWTSCPPRSTESLDTTTKLRKIRGSCDESSLISRTSSDRARQFFRRRKNIWLSSNGLSNWNHQCINVGDLRVQEGTTFRLLFASPTVYIILLYFYNSCRAKQQGASRSFKYVSHKGARQPNVDNH
jgi:hypothetical protein